MKADKKPFFQLFHKYQPSSNDHSIIELLEDYTYRLNKETREIRIDLHLSRLVPKYRLYALEEGIKAAYQLTSCFIFPKYPAELFDAGYKDELLLELSRNTRFAKGFFDDCHMSVEQNEVKIDMKAGYSKLPHASECEALMESIISSEFGLRVKVTLSSEEFDMAAYNRKTEFTMLFDEPAPKAAAPSAPTFEHRAEGAVIPAGLVAQSDFDIDREKNYVKVGNCEFDFSEPEVLFGRKIKEDDFHFLRPLCDLTRNLGSVSFFGKVVSSEEKEIRGNDGFRVKVFVSDGVGSITVKFSGSSDKVKPFMKAAPGTPVFVSGTMQFDTFENEYVVKPRCAVQVRQLKMVDDAEEKRIELHLHTKMSTMDSTIDTADIVKLAHAWGHKAIAITDHGNLQAFPDAMLTAEKLGMKVIYGMEGYYVDDTARVVYGEAHGDFEHTEFVIFDIETTGLSPLSCQITEIGAVLYRNGEVLDRFSTFVDPGMPIPEEITRLTGISDDMVQGAPSPVEAVQNFINFAGDRLLIAHNANFDMGFIKKVAEDHDLPLNNAYLDTLALSRFLNPDLKKHKLDTLQEYFGLEEFNHHRADQDAEMLGKIFDCMIAKMQQEGMTDLDSMLNAMGTSCDPKKLKPYHIILLVKNQVGLKNLYKIVSRSYLDYYARRPRIPKTLLKEHREGLIIGSACSEGELYSAILEGKNFGELLRIADFYDYLEVQPLGNNHYLIRDGAVSGEEKLQEINRTIINLARKKNKMVVATGDVHFMRPEDEIYRQILLSGMEFRDAMSHTPLYMRTTKEMLREFSYLSPELAREIVIENPSRICDMIEDVRPIPKGNYPPALEGAVEELNRACYEKAHAMYGDPLPQLVADRLGRELSAIEKHGFSVLYVIAKRLVQNSEEKGYLVGSRGSVGSSFVATMASISEVNPLVPHYLCPNPECKHSEFIEDGSVGSGFDLPPKNCPLCGSPMHSDGHDIPFETFLGFFGDKSPDIDLNFSGDVQADAHHYTEVLFGAGNVFRAGTIGTLAEKNAYGYVKKYLEKNNIDINNAAKNYLAAGCTGVKKTTGQHPGGIIVIPRDREVYDFTPVQHPADGQGTDTITTHFAFSYLHDTVLKLDILGHDVPTKYKMLEKYTGISVLSVPMRDEKVMSLFESSAALGCDLSQIGVETGTLCLPEFGTKFVRQMLMDTRPKTFADLLQISGLSHGTNVWLGNAQDLIKDGVCTISEVIGTRDNIMTYLIYHNMDKKMSFDIMEKVRKGKGLTPEWEEEMRAHDVPDWYISSCKKIKYMFPKAHAAAYVISAIRLAWFKVYHPVEFYCAYFSAAPEGMDMTLLMNGKEGCLAELERLENTGAKLTQKEKATSDAMQIAFEIFSRGIEILPVDLKKSDAKLFLPENGKIRLPFISIPGLGESAAINIAETMRNQSIFSVEEFKEKSGIGRGVLEMLRSNGVLNSLPETNQLSMF
ncbi:MAG: PolC-type DNA polymerase III [Clostridia bacterium]|nr:PolC-type DNA polymerase III [Clostridia bacterium]